MGSVASADLFRKRGLRVQPHIVAWQGRRGSLVIRAARDHGVRPAPAVAAASRPGRSRQRQRAALRHPSRSDAQALVSEACPLGGCRARDTGMEVLATRGPSLVPIPAVFSFPSGCRSFWRRWAPITYSRFPRPRRDSFTAWGFPIGACARSPAVWTWTRCMRLLAQRRHQGMTRRPSCASRLRRGSSRSSRCGRASWLQNPTPSSPSSVAALTCKRPKRVYAHSVSRATLTSWG